MTRDEYVIAFDPAVKAYAHWYGFAPRELWQTMRWRGIPALKTPSDMWIYQELITRLRPGLVVELGTKYGGTALFMADLMEALGCGKVITIDPVEQDDRPKHPRLLYLLADAREPFAVDFVDEHRRLLEGHLPPEWVRKPTIVIEDADHTYETSAKLLEMYSPFVTPGSYYVVEDTGLGYYDEEPLPGVARAVLEFINSHPEFTVDWECERFGHTVSHGGFLRKAV